MSNGYILEESGMLKRCAEASADLELFKVGIVIRLSLGSKAGTAWCRPQIDADGAIGPFIDAGWVTEIGCAQGILFWRRNFVSLFIASRWFQFSGWCMYRSDRVVKFW